MVLLTHLNTVSDPRRREGRRFDLPHLLLFSLLAIISGANSYRSITRFMDAGYRGQTTISLAATEENRGLSPRFSSFL